MVGKLSTSTPLVAERKSVVVRWTKTVEKSRHGLVDLTGSIILFLLYQWYLCARCSGYTGNSLRSILNSESTLQFLRKSLLRRKRKRVYSCNGDNGSPEPQGAFHLPTPLVLRWIRVYMISSLDPNFIMSCFPQRCFRSFSPHGFSKLKALENMMAFMMHWWCILCQAFSVLCA